MSKNHFLTVDAGTGSVRAVLFDLEGNQTACVQQEWDHKEDPRYPGSMDFNWEYNWNLTCGCIKGVLEQSGISPDDIAAISTTCMREGIVLYDKDEHEIWARSASLERHTPDWNRNYTWNPVRPMPWTHFPACYGSGIKCRTSTKRLHMWECLTTG